MTPEAYRSLRVLIGTQEVAAERLGVTATTIGRRERGEVPVTVEAWLAMLWAAGCPRESSPA